MIKIFNEQKFISYKYAKGEVDIYGTTVHPHYELYLFVNGTVDFVTQKNRVRLNPFTLVIIPPGEYHRFTVIEDIDNYERCVLNIYPEFFEKDFLENALFEKNIIFLSPQNRIVENFMYLKESLLNLVEEDYAHVLPAIATDLVILVKNSTIEQYIPFKTLSPLSSELIQYIDQNIDKPLSLEMLSQRFNFSVSSICHVFKEVFGVSIKKYIMQKKMNLAFSYLHNGEKIEDVCFKIGYSNYSTFFRSYKKHFGIAPSETLKRK